MIHTQITAARSSASHQEQHAAHPRGCSRCYKRIAVSSRRSRPRVVPSCTGGSDASQHQVAAHNDARHQAAADALRMQQRVCCVLWDLDNLLPPRPAQNLLPALREVQAVLRGLGAATVSVQLFANGHTMSRVSPLVAEQLRGADMALVQVGDKQQSADVQLQTAAAGFAQQHRERGCIVLASNDTGFAPVLAYAGSLGARTIALTTVASPKRQPGVLPSLSKHALAAAAHATLGWRARGAQPSGDACRVPLPCDAACWHRLDGSLAFLDDALWINSLT